MAVVTVIILATFVLPKFRTFFSSLNAKLPLPTRMLLSVSDFISTWWWAHCRHHPARRRRIHRPAAFDEGAGLAGLASFSKLPVAGSLLQAAIIERVCRVLSSLVTAGVDLPRAHVRHSRSIQQRCVQRRHQPYPRADDGGAGLAEPLAATGLFPAAARQMFRVGEETGTLDKQLETAAVFYHRELEIKVKHFTSLFEPAIIIFMGLIVGFVAVALVSAMYGIYRQVNIG